MRKLITNQSKYEALLTMYFEQEVKPYLSEKMIESLNGFIDFFRIEDKYNNTSNADAIKKIYSNQGYDSREQLLKSINMSETTLFRFRTKIVERLETHLQETFNGLHT